MRAFGFTDERWGLEQGTGTRRARVRERAREADGGRRSKSDKASRTPPAWLAWLAPPCDVIEA